MLIAYQKGERMIFLTEIVNDDDYCDMCVKIDKTELRWSIAGGIMSEYSPKNKEYPIWIGIDYADEEGLIIFEKEDFDLVPFDVHILSSDDFVSAACKWRF